MTSLLRNLKVQAMSDRPRKDFLASIVVFLVALPLSLNIALANGVPVIAAASLGGIVLSFAILLRRMGHVRIDIRTMENRTHILVDGTLSFLTVPKLAARLAEVPQGAPVEIDLHVDLMDHAAFESLPSREGGHIRAGGEVEIVEHRAEWYGDRNTRKPRVAKASLALKEVAS